MVLAVRRQSSACFWNSSQRCMCEVPDLCRSGLTLRITTGSGLIAKERVNAALILPMRRGRAEMVTIAGRKSVLLVHKKHNKTGENW